MLALTTPLRALAARAPRLTVGYRVLTESAMPETFSNALSPDMALHRSDLSGIHERAFTRAEAVATSTAVPEIAGYHFGETQRSHFASELADVAETCAFAIECARSSTANNVIAISTSRRRARAIARALRARGSRALPLGLPDRDRERKADDEQIQALRFLRDDEEGRADVLVISESNAMAAMLLRVVEELSARGEHSVAYAHGEFATPSSEEVRAARAEAAVALAAAAEPEDATAGLDEVEQGLVRALRRRRLVEAILTCEAAEAILDEVMPRLLVVGNDRVWTAQLLIQAARNRGIQVLCVQDGLAADVPAWWLRTADYTACNGTHLRDLLVHRGVPVGQLAVTGQPRNDVLHARASQLDRVEAKRELALEPDGLHLLIALQGNHDAEYVRSVLREASRLPKATILVRTHPWQSSALVASVVKELDLHNVQLRPADETAVALRAADVVISQYSTMLVEAALLGTPAVAVTLSRRANPIDLADEGIAVAANRRSEILPAIRAALSREPEAERAARAAAERLIGPFDGRSTTRVADYITELLTARSADPGTASDGGFARIAPMPAHP